LAAPRLKLPWIFPPCLRQFSFAPAATWVFPNRKNSIAPGKTAGKEDWGSGPDVACHALKQFPKKRSSFAAFFRAWETGTETPSPNKPRLSASLGSKGHWVWGFFFLQSKNGFFYGNPFLPAGACPRLLATRPDMKIAGPFLRGIRKRRPPED